MNPRKLLLDPEFIVFTTQEFAGGTGMSRSAASHMLGRLAAQGLLTSITRGVWARTEHPYFDPLACSAPILGKESGYVTFLSALYLHGALSQIPARIQLASTGTPRVVTTPVGTFEIFRVKPEMHRSGITWSDTRTAYRIATIEKALLDTIYLSTRRGRRFARLPELELAAAAFSKRRFLKLLREQVADPRIRSAVASRYAAIEANETAQEGRGDATST